MSAAGRRVVVTGAGSGIGRATAVRLAGGGARVGLVGRRVEALEETAGFCRSAGGPPPLVLPCDVTDEAAVGALAGRVDSEWGGLEGLVNNAGEAHYAALADTTLADWSRILAVNLTGPFLVTRATLPLLRRGDRAAVVMVASTLALYGLRHASAYCAAKAGLVNFARAAALDEAENDVRVNVVCPGVVDTAMLDSERVPEASRKVLRARLAALHPLGRRLARPEEVAAAIAWFLAPDAGFVTGSVLTVDGGLSAGHLE